MKWLSSLFSGKPDKSISKAIQGSMIPPVKENISPYSQKRKYPMALLLPNENLTVKFNGRIVYQIQLPGKGSGFDTGIEFYGLTEHGKKSLKRFISSPLWKHEA